MRLVQTGALGILECNRCRLLKLQDEARVDDMVITKRKSMYGVKKERPGVDIYIHPKNVEIPSTYKFLHNGNVGTLNAMASILPDDDPEKWFVAWFSDIPPQCVCKTV